MGCSGTTSRLPSRSSVTTSILMVGVLIILLVGKKTIYEPHLSCFIQSSSNFDQIISPKISIMFRQIGESDDGDHPDSGQDAAGRLSGWGRQACQHSHAEGEEEEVCLW